MYSEENERLAEQAYNRYRSTHDTSAPEWAAYAPKHLWRDLVQTFEANPRSHTAIANLMEQCVSDVLLNPATITAEQFNEAKKILSESALTADAPIVLSDSGTQLSKPKPTKSKK